MSSPENLYTTKDITRVREQLYNAQEGIDPILKEKIELSGSVLDHSHVTQNCRATLHRQSNAFEGLVFNAYRRCLQWVTDKPLPEILRNLAEYLEGDYSNNPIHTGHLKRLQTDFNSLPEGGKKVILETLGSSQGGNSSERKTLFKSLLMKRKLTFEEVSKLIQLNKKEKQ